MLPDILTRTEIERLINGARELRYQTFILTAYSMGLRLGEVLNLQPGDIDSARMKVHVRQGKGKKDRFVTLPTACAAITPSAVNTATHLTQREEKDTL